MKNILKITFCLCCASMLFAACNKAETWTPGPEDNEVGVQAYFPEQSTSVILSPEEPLLITTTIKRVDIFESISIPVTVNCTSDGISYPKSVEFESGEDEASLVIDCSGLPIGESQTITIDLPEDQTDVYSSEMTSLSISVIVSKWVIISDNVTYYYTESDGKKMFPNTSGEMYHLENTDYFRLTNFFASGLDVMFQISGPEKQTFTPMTNAYWDDDGYDNVVWYLFDEENNDWFNWKPDPTAELGIYYLEFYHSISYSSFRMIYDKEKKYGYASFGSYISQTGEDDDWTWMNLQIDFNLKYNPFE